MFDLKFDYRFVKDFDKKIKKNKLLEKSIQKTFDIIEINPFYPSLHTHKVDTKNYTGVFSSRITGD
jgi:mRNA-degrading endonuclease YafQ of YafQ-DinJ toxin-antitoxin module